MPSDLITDDFIATGGMLTLLGALRMFGLSKAKPMNAILSVILIVPVTIFMAESGALNPLFFFTCSLECSAEDYMFQGQLMALAAALSCALSSNLYNMMGERLTSDMIGYVRMFVAVPLGFILLLIFEGSFPTGYSVQIYLMALLSGFIGFFLCDYYMFKAIVTLGSRETSVIMTLNPALTAIMSFFLFSERLTPVQILGMVITVGGVSLMVAGERGGDKTEKSRALKTGLICALLGAVLQSVSDVTAKAALSDIPSVSTNMLRLLGGLAAWVVFGFIRREDYARQFKTFKDPRYVVMMLFSVILGPVLGVTLTLGAMEMIPAGVVRSLSQTSPVFLIPIDLIRKKKVSALSLLGTLVSVAGVSLLF